METKDTSIQSIWKKSGEDPDYDVKINISEKEKFFLWLWDKTGTSLSKKILSNFDFHFYGFKNGQKEIISSEITQYHICKLFPGHKDYQMLATVRNPYTRVFSSYCQGYRPRVGREFENFVQGILLSERNFECSLFNERVPNYFVRVENVFEDYSKIPFIRKSSLYQSGALFEICSSKVNPSKHALDWRDFYDKSLADLVYYGNQSYFELFGYDKNSWKK